VKDTKLESIVSKLVPNIEDYYTYEESEVKRHLKSRDNKIKIREMNKVKKAQQVKLEKIKKDKIKLREKKRNKKEYSKSKIIK